MNRIIFGLTLYEKLSEVQRVAVAAHELVHVKEGDYSYALKHIALPSYLLFVGILISSIWAGRLFLLVVLLALFVWVACQTSLMQIHASWRREAELRCDVIAASFIDGRDLIEALRIQSSLVTPKQRRSWGYRFASRMYPSQVEREEAILRVVEGQGTRVSA